MTLLDLGTPWAEQYRGNGRFTGRLQKEPVYTDTGEVAPGWTWIGDWTKEEYDAELERRNKAFEKSN